MSEAVGLDLAGAILRACVLRDVGDLAQSLGLSTPRVYQVAIQLVEDAEVQQRWPIECRVLSQHMERGREMRVRDERAGDC